MELPLTGRLEIPALLAHHGLSDYEIGASAVGNDDQIHLLLGRKNPAKSRTHYQALSLVVDWKTGELLHHEVTDFGRHELGIHFIQRLGKGFLLLGSRCRRYPDGSADKNARITDESGKLIAEFCFGDGIADCLVDRKNRIITSYFDEGVFGNYGWNDPIGSCGLIVWSEQGERVWENRNHDICDCYAINLDASDHLWFYYYTAFALVRTNYQSETVYLPKISGSSAFLIHGKGRQILFDAGYDKHGTFLVKRIDDTELVGEEFAVFTWEGEPLHPKLYTFRGSKALLWDKADALHFTDWS